MPGYMKRIMATLIAALAGFVAGFSILAAAIGLAIWIWRTSGTDMLYIAVPLLVPGCCCLDSWFQDFLVESPWLQFPLWINLPLSLGTSGSASAYLWRSTLGSSRLPKNQTETRPRMMVANNKHLVGLGIESNLPYFMARPLAA